VLGVQVVAPDRGTDDAVFGKGALSSMVGASGKDDIRDSPVS
jgi:hypothetical protein